MEFRAEFFNILNHPNFAQPAGGPYSPGTSTDGLPHHWLPGGNRKPTDERGRDSIHGDGDHGSANQRELAADSVRIEDHVLIFAIGHMLTVTPHGANLPTVLKWRQWECAIRVTHWKRNIGWRRIVGSFSLVRRAERDQWGRHTVSKPLTYLSSCLSCSLSSKTRLPKRPLPSHRRHYDRPALHNWCPRTVA